MNSPLSIMLAVSLTTATLSEAAQDGTKSPPGPIARAIAREAVRLTVDPQTGPTNVEWLRVRTLAPGTAIILTTGGSQPGERYAVRADASDLTVLNVSGAGLPEAAKDVLRGVVSNHPEHLQAVDQGGSLALEKGLRLGPDGVFMNGRKVAELRQVVERIARNDVAEIKTRQKGRGVWGHLGPLGGFLIGAMSGGYAAGFACQAAAGRDRCDTGAFLAGSLVGGLVGGGYGWRASNRETENVIYHAP